MVRVLFALLGLALLVHAAERDRRFADGRPIQLSFNPIEQAPEKVPVIINQQPFITVNRPSPVVQVQPARPSIIEISGKSVPASGLNFEIPKSGYGQRILPSTSGSIQLNGNLNSFSGDSQFALFGTGSDTLLPGYPQPGPGLVVEQQDVPRREERPVIIQKPIAPPPPIIIERPIVPKSVVIQRPVAPRPVIIDRPVVERQPVILERPRPIVTVQSPITYSNQGQNPLANAKINPEGCECKPFETKNIANPITPVIRRPQTIPVQPIRPTVQITPSVIQEIRRPVVIERPLPVAPKTRPLIPVIEPNRRPLEIITRPRIPQISKNEPFYIDEPELDGPYLDYFESGLNVPPKSGYEYVPEQPGFLDYQPIPATRPIVKKPITIVQKPIRPLIRTEVLQPILPPPPPARHPVTIPPPPPQIIRPVVLPSPPVRPVVEVRRPPQPPVRQVVEVHRPPPPPVRQVVEVRRPSPPVIQEIQRPVAIENKPVSVASQPRPILLERNQRPLVINTRPRVPQISKNQPLYIGRPESNGAFLDYFDYGFNGLPKSGYEYIPQEPGYFDYQPIPVTRPIVNPISIVEKPRRPLIGTEVQPILPPPTSPNRRPLIVPQPPIRPVVEIRKPPPPPVRTVVEVRRPLPPPPTRPVVEVRRPLPPPPVRPVVEVRRPLPPPPQVRPIVQVRKPPPPVIQEIQRPVLIERPIPVPQSRPIIIQSKQQPQEIITRPLGPEISRNQPLYIGRPESEGAYLDYFDYGLNGFPKSDYQYIPQEPGYLDYQPIPASRPIVKKPITIVEKPRRPLISTEVLQPILQKPLPPPPIRQPLVPIQPPGPPLRAVLTEVRRPLPPPPSRPVITEIRRKIPPQISPLAIGTPESPKPIRISISAQPRPPVQIVEISPRPITPPISIQQEVIPAPLQPIQIGAPPPIFQAKITPPKTLQLPNFPISIQPESRTILSAPFVEQQRLGIFGGPVLSSEAKTGYGIPLVAPGFNAAVSVGGVKQIQESLAGGSLVRQQQGTSATAILQSQEATGRSVAQTQESGTGAVVQTQEATGGSVVQTQEAGAGGLVQTQQAGGGVIQQHQEAVIAGEARLTQSSLHQESPGHFNFNSHFGAGPAGSTSVKTLFKQQITTIPEHTI